MFIIKIFNSVERKDVRTFFLHSIGGQIIVVLFTTYRKTNTRIQLLVTILFAPKTTEFKALFY